MKSDIDRLKEKADGVVYSTGDTDPVAHVPIEEDGKLGKPCNKQTGKLHSSGLEAFKRRRGARACPFCARKVKHKPNQHFLTAPETIFAGLDVQELDGNPFLKRAQE